MTLKECYDNMNADYDEVMKRLHSEAIVKKFILKFPSQSGFDGLCAAMDKNDYKAAFAAAHTLKGLCLNLSFKELGESSSKLTEALRKGDFAQSDLPLYEKVKLDYEKTCKAIDALRKSE